MNAREPRLVEVAFWLSIAAAVAPLLATQYLPFTDLPEHVAVMSTLARWFDAGGAEHATYDISFWDSQYLLYHGTGALLTRVVGDAILANRLLLIGLAIALPLSVRAALRAFERDDGLAVLACMPFLSRPLFVGFLPYMASLPLYFVGVALVVRRAKHPKSRRRASVLLAMVAVALFYTHLSALSVFLVTTVALELVVAARTEDEVRPTLLGWSMARVRALVWLVPVGVVAGVWSLAGRVTLRADSLNDPGEIGKMEVSRSIHALPLWAFDVFRSHVDEICGGLWWSVLAVLAVLGVRAAASGDGDAAPPPPSDRPFVLRMLGRLDAGYVPLCCALAIYFVTPFRVGAGGMLNVRLAPLIALAAILTIGRSRGTWRTVCLCAGAFATLLHAGNAVRETRSLAREYMTGFDEILAAMRPGTKLVTLVFDQRTTRTHFHPYPFAGSYHRARGGLIASYSFSDLVHWPMQYRGPERPPQKGTPLWIYDPCAYRHAVDGPYYDYVLVMGVAEPFRGEPAGPAFREAQRAPGFVLYEKAPGKPWTGDDLGGPCAR